MRFTNIHRQYTHSKATLHNVQTAYAMCKHQIYAVQISYASYKHPTYRTNTLHIVQTLVDKTNNYKFSPPTNNHSTTH